MTTTHAITHALTLSLQAHINRLWRGDVYSATSPTTLVQEGYCPPALVPTLQYIDRDGNNRIFGPSSVTIGRLQEDLINLARNPVVPSSYIEIVANDYEDIEAWRHSVTRSQDPSKRIGPDIPIMIGGELQQVRRFVVKMVTYFLESDQDISEVSRLGNAAASFIEGLCTAKWELPYPWGWELKDESGNRIKDPFGETPWTCHAPLTHTRVRGGPPDNYIFDTKVYVEVVSYKEAE